MAQIIRAALLQKTLERTDLRQVCADFSAVTGLVVRFVDELGHDPAGTAVLLPTMCGCVQSCPAGQRLCQQTQARLRQAARDRPASVSCDAGLTELAVPLHISGMLVGYFVVIGVSTIPINDPERRRIEHLLRVASVGASTDRLHAALAEHPLIPTARLESCARLLLTMAEHVSQQMTGHIALPVNELPPLIRQATQEIRRRAMTEPLQLADIATACGVSPAHLSRTFHHATGLKFNEYVARWRVENARSRLLDTHDAITQIALDCGFGSLSQFNRIFRKTFGVAPRQLRAQRERLPIA